MVIEDSLASLQRRRVLADLELIPEITLTEAHNTAIDSLCELCPLVDEPNLIARITDIDQPAAVALLKQLPYTHAIFRLLETWGNTAPQPASWAEPE